MIVVCGIDELPCGPWTAELAARFADRLGAELRTADAGALTEEADVLAFGHAPPRRLEAVLRERPCPVVVAPGGVSTSDWREVVLGCPGDACTEQAAATAGVLARRLGVPLRIVVVEPVQQDAADRLAGAAIAAGGPELEVETEVRHGRASDEVLRAAGAQPGSVIVAAGESRRRWAAFMRPSFTAELVHHSRDLVVVT